jgi:hypothetical protein
MALEAMDVNEDGSVSRQEYMAHYEGLFAKMKKDSSGKNQPEGYWLATTRT